MHPQAHALWRAPHWMLAALLAMLAMLGPFAIDTYLPAFEGIAASLGASGVQMQQTLSAYLFGFAFMNLFHGALADRFGRRPVVLWGLAVFGIASVGAALAQNIGQLIAARVVQGLSCGAGVVVSRAIVRDMFAQAQAQRVMSQITIFFGVAPAIAPVLGGWLFVGLGWRSIFWLLALIAFGLWLINWRMLPETLHESQRQSLHVRSLMSGYWGLCSDARFVLLALASGVPFNGMFIYVLSAPEFLGQHLGLGPTEFFWLFLLVISGIMGGAWVSGRLAGRVAARVQVRWGFIIMMSTAVVNVAANMVLEPHVAWALIPVGLFGFGWSLVVPVVTLLVLDLNPERRGMASSLQAVVTSTANGIVAGVLAPLVMHSTVALAAAALALTAVGQLSWFTIRKRWPELGA